MAMLRARPRPELSERAACSGLMAVSLRWPGAPPSLDWPMPLRAVSAGAARLPSPTTCGLLPGCCDTTASAWCAAAGNTAGASAPR